MAEAQKSRTEAATQPTGQQSYVGMWVTKDGYIRHELLPNGRYDEARGQKQSAYQGNYILTGNNIDYVDDTGFTADGEFRDGILYHGGISVPRGEKVAQSSRYEGLRTTNSVVSEQWLCASGCFIPGDKRLETGHR